MNIRSKTGTLMYLHLQNGCSVRGMGVCDHPRLTSALAPPQSNFFSPPPDPLDSFPTQSTAISRMESVENEIEDKASRTKRLRKERNRRHYEKRKQK